MSFRWCFLTRYCESCLALKTVLSNARWKRWSNQRFIDLMFTFYIKLFLFCSLSAISHYWHIMSSSSTVLTNSEAFFFVLDRRTHRFIARTMHRERRHHIVENSLESSDRVNDQITHVEIQMSLKRLLNDVTMTANNDVTTKRQRVKSRSKLNFAMRRRRSSSSASRLYASMFSSSSTSLSSIRVRRSERLISRSSSSSPFMSSKNHEDLVDWEKSLKKELRDVENDDFVHISQYEQQSESTTTRRDRSRNDATKNDDDFVSLTQLESQSFISSSTSRGQSSTIRRDDRKLDNNWMIARKSNIFVTLYTLFCLRQKSNVCSHCKIYQYDEKCRERLEKQKYWHCCSNDKVLIDTMSFEDDFETLETLSKSQKKKSWKIERQTSSEIYRTAYMRFASTLTKRSIERKSIESFKSWLSITTIFFFFVARSSTWISNIATELYFESWETSSIH